MLKKILIAVGSVLGFVLFVGWCASGPSAPPASTETVATAERVVTEAQDVGLVTKVDEQVSHFYVNPAAWAELTFDRKKGFTRAFAIHFKERGQTGYAHVYDNMTGKRIATITSGGVFSVQ